MKQLVIILMMMLCHSAYAQKGMHISALFEGKIVPSSKMVETRIRGKAISKYKLSYFHSVRFDADGTLVNKIDHLTAQDFVDDTENANKYRLSLGDRGLANLASTIAILLGQDPHESWLPPIIEEE